MDIQKKRKVDVTKVDPQTLVDIREIKIDSKLIPRKRMEQYIQQIRNPYCYKYGDYIVKIGFANNGITLEEKKKELILKMEKST